MPSCPEKLGKISLHVGSTAAEGSDPPSWKPPRGGDESHVMTVYREVWETNVCERVEIKTTERNYPTLCKQTDSIGGAEGVGAELRLKWAWFWFTHVWMNLCQKLWGERPPAGWGWSSRRASPAGRCSGETSACRSRWTWPPGWRPGGAGFEAAPCLRSGWCWTGSPLQDHNKCVTLTSTVLKMRSLISRNLLNNKLTRRQHIKYIKEKIEKQ